MNDSSNFDHVQYCDVIDRKLQPARGFQHVPPLLFIPHHLEALPLHKRIRILRVGRRCRKLFRFSLTFPNASKTHRGYSLKQHAVYMHNDVSVLGKLLKFTKQYTDYFTDTIVPDLPPIPAEQELEGQAQPQETLAL